MKQSQLRYFAWISLIMMALVSCRSSKIIISGDKATVIHPSFFSGSFEKQTFKAKVSFHEKELSGLMLVKNAGDGNYKIAFFNELGITYLEGAFENSSKHKKLVINNIAPIIDYGVFLKSFRKSLQIAFTDETNPRLAASPPPHSRASTPPFPPAPLRLDSVLKIQLRNGFILELSPQIIPIGAE